MMTKPPSETDFSDEPKPPDLEARAQALADRLVANAATGEGAEEAPASRLRFALIEEFAAEREASAEPILGTDDDLVIPAGGTVMAYGDGGAGKTTLELDAALHFAAGDAWLGFPVPRPLRVALVENEGPRGSFRAKVERKLAAWKGSPFAGRLHVLEEPWAELSLAEDVHLAGLRDFLNANAVDVLMLGPVASSGLAGGGTPDEIEEHARRLAELRRDLDRPLVVWLVHHENKAGDVSGAWERLPDVLLHVRAGDGGGYTLLRWRKARWSSRTHGCKMTLRWTADGEGFELADSDDAAAAKRDAARDEASAWLRAYVTDHPGTARTTIEENYAEGRPTGARARIREAIDRALKPAQTDSSPLADDNPANQHPDGEHTNWLATGPGKAANGVYLYPASALSSPLAIPLNGEHGEHPAPVSQTPQERECSPLAATYKEAAANGEQRAGSPTSTSPLDDLLARPRDTRAMPEGL